MVVILNQSLAIGSILFSVWLDVICNNRFKQMEDFLLNGILVKSNAKFVAQWRVNKKLKTVEFSSYLV